MIQKSRVYIFYRRRQQEEDEQSFPTFCQKGIIRNKSKNIL